MDQMQRNAYLDEHDRLPLKLRLKTLLLNGRLSGGTDISSVIPGNRSKSTPISEDVAEIAEKRSHSQVLVDPCIQDASSNQYVDKPVAVKIKCEDESPIISLGDGNAGSGMLAVKNKDKILDGSVDELDCISLRERQSSLYARKSLGMMKPLMQGDSEQLSNQAMECHMGAKPGERHFSSGSSPVVGLPSSSILDDSVCNHFKISSSASSDDTVSGSSSATHQHASSVNVIQGTESTCERVKESFPLPEKISGKVDPCDVPAFVPALPNSTCGLTLSTSAKTKDEPSDCNDLHSPGNIEPTNSKTCLKFHESGCKCLSDNSNKVTKLCESQDSVPTVPDDTLGSALSACVQVKDEPSYHNYLNSSDKNAVGCSTNFLSVKDELQTPDDYIEDPLDHMPLQDRIKLRKLENFPSTNTFNNFKCFPENVPSSHERRSFVSDSAKPNSAKRLRKRKKTATDSVKTALEEDAPGLLQALADNGVSMDEIMLYGAMGSDGMLDDSIIEDSFSELQSVMSKIFDQRQTLLKLAPIRSTKGSKASYCLACLLSLIDQARYLRFRKWPVEWGWCRELQSFIFVFERHRRIVLERPEYGFATYFFELADSLPIEWQIKRLVITMKLTNFSRITLIENKALSVGEDLSEGEAKVMMEYGWIPNNGLATMLNYRGRVVHDRRNENAVDWKSKIVKLLMEGYNGGILVSMTIPKKVAEYNAEKSPQVKSEM